MTKVDVISGFLGAGKTTLIKKLLQEALKGEQVVLIENEFGEIGIDGGFLKDAGVQITEMSQGCICCSLVGDFGKALNEVITTYHPDRVIIEPSGVGKLSDVMAAVKRVSDECELSLNSATTVADASKVKIYMKNFGEFYDDQVKNAGAIVLSRTQNVSEDKLALALELLREKNPDARILTTSWDTLDGAKILAAMEDSQNLTLSLMEEAHRLAELEEDDDDDDDEECSCGCGHHHHHHHHHHGDHDADEVFTSWGKESPKKFDKENLDAILEKLSESSEYGMILRAKGIVPLTDGTWGYFDLVPGEYEIRSGESDYTGRFCVIGSDLQEEKLATLFGF